MCYVFWKLLQCFFFCVLDVFHPWPKLFQKPNTPVPSPTPGKGKFVASCNDSSWGRCCPGEIAAPFQEPFSKRRIALWARVQQEELPLQRVPVPREGMGSWGLNTFLLISRAGNVCENRSFFFRSALWSRMGIPLKNYISWWGWVSASHPLPMEVSAVRQSV